MAESQRYCQQSNKQPNDGKTTEALSDHPRDSRGNFSNNHQTPLTNTNSNHSAGALVTTSLTNSISSNQSNSPKNPMEQSFYKSYTSQNAAVNKSITSNVHQQNTGKISGINHQTCRNNQEYNNSRMSMNDQQISKTVNNQSGASKVDFNAPVTASQASLASTQNLNSPRTSTSFPNSSMSNDVIFPRPRWSIHPKGGWKGSYSQPPPTLHKVSRLLT